MTRPAAEPRFIGIDITGPILRAALVSASGQVEHRRELELKRDELISQIAGLVVDLRDLTPSIAAIGVGLPGLVNRLTDKVFVSADLPVAVKGDFHAELTAATGLRVEIENDANAAAYGEFHVGAGRGSRDIFYVTIGTGIGGALILDGKLWTGASGFAGEFGHITIDAEGGAQCVCGNIGCLETVASAPNIVRRTHERLYRDSTSSLSRLALNREFTADDVANEALNGDDFAAMMLERTGKYIGVAVASVINLLNIEKIVLGGGVMGAGELILNPIINEAHRRAFQPSFEATQIVVATLGHDAVPIGAALLARDAHHTEER
jgi:glucokinase